MIKRVLTALIPVFWATGAWAIDVSTIISCKADGEVWLCAAWRNGEVEVFRSEHYITQVEFSGSVTEAGRSKGARAMPSMKAAEVAPGQQAKYTLQLLACKSQTCRDRMAKLDKIPGSRVVEIKSEGKLWQVLIVGEFASAKAAQQGAAKLMTRYKLRDKPWARSLESIRRRQVRY